MDLITEEMTARAATLVERAVRYCADTAALVDDIKEFSLQCGRRSPEGLSLQAMNEIDDWVSETLGVHQVYSLLDVAISTIVSHHDSGTFEPFSDAEVVERMERAKLALSVLQADDTAPALAVAN